MAVKNLSELTEATTMGGDDLILIETADGTRSIKGNKAYAGRAGDADTVDGYHVNDSPSADPRGKIPIVKSDGVMEVGKYIDFHVSTADWDNDARITAGYDKMEIDKPIESPGIKTSSLTVSRSFSGYGDPQFVVENPTYPNAKVIGYVDQEGANFRLQCNEGNNYFEFDTLGNNLRLYHYYNGATPTLISSVGSGNNLELQIGRATKDGSGNNIVNTYATKTELNTLKNSVSNGKKAVADAITAKGVSTATTADFSAMATNIGKISTGLIASFLSGLTLTTPYSSNYSSSQSSSCASFGPSTTISFNGASYTCWTLGWKNAVNNYSIGNLSTNSNTVYAVILYNVTYGRYVLLTPALGTCTVDVSSKMSNGSAYHEAIRVSLYTSGSISFNTGTAAAGSTVHLTALFITQKATGASC